VTQQKRDDLCEKTVLTLLGYIMSDMIKKDNLKYFYDSLMYFITTEDLCSL